MTGPIKAWSLSRWQTWRQCPRKLKYQAIDRLPEPKSDALIRGQKIHDRLEGYLKGKLQRVPSVVATADLKKRYRELRRQMEALNEEGFYAEVEESWAFNDRWEPTGWFDRDAWLRMKIDAYYVAPTPAGFKAVIVDHKSGKVRAQSGQQQLDLYALGAFQAFDELGAGVDAALYYVDHGEVVQSWFDPDTTHYLKDQWERRVEPMMKDTTFAPTPGWYCQYCPFNAKVGGPCEAGR